LFYNVHDDKFARKARSECAVEEKRRSKLWGKGGQGGGGRKGRGYGRGFEVKGDR
jgi:hypothetical protein